MHQDIQMLEDRDYILRCLELAEAAFKAGNGPFASLVVRDGEIIGEGINQVMTTKDVSAHAEVNALRQATQRLGSLDLSACTLYTSAEPCFMCSYAIRQARIAQVVIGARAEARGGVSSRHPILTEADIPGWGPPPRIVRDILLEECTSLLHSCGFVHI
jgi:tRNA(adenine34) deaminase